MYIEDYCFNGIDYAFYYRLWVFPKIPNLRHA